jgi:UDP-glucose 4-epimerase
MLVTGGAGFIGSNLVGQLRREGHDVAVLDNLLSGYAANLVPHPDVHWIEGDVRDPVAVAEAMRGADVVFHLAACVGNKRSIDDPLLDAEINAIGTLRVLEAARAARVEKVVLSSSAGVFGELKELPIREGHPAEPESPYGCSKLYAEKLALSYAKLHGLKAVCLRYFNVYGPSQRFDAYGNVIPIFVFNILRGAPVTVFGDGEQTRDFVNVRDVVRANIGAGLARGVSGPFNIASATSVSINRLLQHIEQAIGVRARVEHQPPRLGDVRDSLADITSAERAFGYKPAVGLEEGLAEYVRWAREELESGPSARRPIATS